MSFVVKFPGGGESRRSAGISTKTRLASFEGPSGGSLSGGFRGKWRAHSLSVGMSGKQIPPMCYKFDITINIRNSYKCLLLIKIRLTGSNKVWGTVNGFGKEGGGSSPLISC